MEAGPGDDGTLGSRFITPSGEVGMGGTLPLLEPGSWTEQAPAINAAHRAATVIHALAILGFFIAAISLTGR